MPLWLPVKIQRKQITNHPIILVDEVTRPELRITAMALMEFTQGAFASVVIILFGRYADKYGLTQTLLILTVGFWIIALLVTTALYFVYPAESHRLRQEMETRRQILLENAES